ncbi:2714_t:CDS:2, partial [Acaulospora colombiana]
VTAVGLLAGRLADAFIEDHEVFPHLKLLHTENLKTNGVDGDASGEVERSLEKDLKAAIGLGQSNALSSLYSKKHDFSGNRCERVSQIQGKEITDIEGPVKYVRSNKSITVVSKGMVLKE